MKTNKKETVCITGSSRGLGEALALMFARKGFSVILHGRSRRSLEAVAGKVRLLRSTCRVVKGDLSRRATLKKICRLAKDSHVSVFINNAAVLCPHLPFEKLTDEKIEKMYRVNLLAPVALMRAMYPYFISRGGGAFININSVSGLTPQRHRSIYCSSKWGLRGFDEAFRLECGGHHVRVLSVFPSRIKTNPSLSHGMEPKQAAEKIFEAYAFGKGNVLVLDDRPSKAGEKKS